MGGTGVPLSGPNVHRRLIRRSRALPACLAMAGTLLVPLHIHTSPWSSADPGGMAFQTVTDGTGCDEEGGVVCLACALAARVRTSLTVDPVGPLAVPTVASVTLPLPRSGLEGGTPRQASPRGPPSFS